MVSITDTDKDFAINQEEISDSTNARTIQEMCSNYPHYKAQYNLLIKNIKKLFKIFDIHASNMMILISKLVETRITQLKDQYFDKNITPDNKLAELLDYKDTNNIKLTKLLLDIKGKLNALYKNIVSDNSIKNSTKITEKYKSTAKVQSDNKSYDGPINDMDYTEERNNIYNTLGKNESCDLRNNLKQYISIFEHLLDIIQTNIISDPVYIILCNLFTNDCIINRQDIFPLINLDGYCSGSEELESYFRTYVHLQVNNASDLIIGNQTLESYFKKNIHAKVNNTIDTIIGSIKNIKTLPVKEIQEKVLNECKKFCIKENNNLPFDNLYCNMLEFASIPNIIMNYYDKFTQAKFKLKSEQKPKEFARLLLVNCFREGCELISNIKLKFSINNVDNNVEMLCNNTDKKEYLRQIMNLNSHANEIKKIDEVFKYLSTPITKKLEDIAENELISNIKNLGSDPGDDDEDKLQKKQILDSFQTSIAVLDKLSKCTKYCYKLDDITKLYKNIGNVISKLTVLFKKMSIFDDNIDTPTILLNLNEAIQDMNDYAENLDEIASGHAPTNKFPGLVSNEDWDTELITKLVRDIHETVDNIRNKLQKVLDKIKN